MDALINLTSTNYVFIMYYTNSIIKYVWTQIRVVLVLVLNIGLKQYCN